MSTEGKQIPHPTELDLEFFESITSTGALHVQQCDGCGDHHHPPRLFCPACFSGDYSFAAVGGLGTVYGYTVSHYTTERGWKDALPYVTIVVELAEGPRLVGSARGIAPEEVVLGLPVRVVPEKVADDFAYLWVEKA